MQGLTIIDTPEQIIFTIDKKDFTEKSFMQFMRIARVEYLINKAAFDNSIIDFGNELKSNLWNENRTEIMKRIGK